MSKTTQEQQSIHTNVEQAGNNDYFKNVTGKKIIERFDYKNPIKILKTDMYEYFGVVGNNRVTPIFDTEEEVKKYMNEEVYEVMTVIACITSEQIIKESIREIIQEKE